MDLGTPSLSSIPGDNDEGGPPSFYIQGPSAFGFPEHKGHLGDVRCSGGSYCATRER